MTDLTYTVVCTKRKTIALSLDAAGNLTVRAPLHTSRAVIEDVILRHRDWICRRQDRIAAARAKYPPFSLRDGAVLPYLGGTLTICLDACSSIRISGGRLLLPLRTAESELIAWLKVSLRQILSERVPFYAQQTGLQPQSITVTSAKTRWGSCSAADRLNFSFRLIFCPPDVIDYIVVHELAHIRHKNHSAQFWQQVAAILPKHRNQRQWLRENAVLMELL